MCYSINTKEFKNIIKKTKFYLDFENVWMTNKKDTELMASILTIGSVEAHRSLLDTIDSNIGPQNSTNIDCSKEIDLAELLLIYTHKTAFYLRSISSLLDSE